MNTKKPIIGIVLKHFVKKETHPTMHLSDEVKQAIFDNGGIAIGITLPKMERKLVSDKWSNNLNSDEFEALISQINLCDGIVIQGGGACDNYEMIVAKYCYDENIPILGICCGQNVLVRALGGTTFKITNPEKHDTNAEYAHGIKIDKTSYFYKIVQKRSMSVNSRHSKAVENCPFLEKTAFCEDGYADVVESKEKDFYLAVRFHPESLYKKDPNHNKIFIEFINKCKLRCKNKCH